MKAHYTEGSIDHPTKLIEFRILCPAKPAEIKTKLEISASAKLKPLFSKLTKLDMTWKKTALRQRETEHYKPLPPHVIYPLIRQTWVLWTQ